jgi:GNAT superfamily N-acetyltransferase
MQEIRRAAETDDLRPLWNKVFLPDEVFFSRGYRPERALIITDGGKPVSMLHILPQTLLLGGAEVTGGYIMGVATDPEYRRRGLAGRLVTKALDMIEKQGKDCAMLIPASAGLAVYYQRFGLTVRGKMPKVRGIPSDFRSARMDDIPALSAMYEAAFADRVLRSAFEWETILLGYSVLMGGGWYTVADGDTLHERVPVPGGTPECERAACIKPFTLHAKRLLEKHVPYINLLYT